MSLERAVPWTDEYGGAYVERPPDGGPIHRVQFYEADELLVRAVTSFLADGLEAHEPALVIATDAHAAAFADGLRARGLPVDALATSGLYLALDARATLASFMVGGLPDAQLFRSRLDVAVARLTRAAGGRMRAFGEMVELLWRDGNAPAASRLEELWKERVRAQPLSLLCAYSMGHFDTEAQSAAFADVCGQHTSVAPALDLALAPDPRMAQQISLLQQRARALEAEVRKRQALETALREALAAQSRAQQDARRSELQMIEQLAGLGLLHEMSLQLASETELAPMLRAILATATALSGTAMGLLSLCDDEHRRLDLGATQGFSPDVLAELDHVPAGGGACGRCWQTRQRVVVEDVDADPAFGPYREVARRAGFRAVHSTPLITRAGHVLGVLSAHFPEPRRPSERELYLLDLCARQAVDFIENARLCGRLRENDRRKDEFLATLAHELRNPLAPIQNAVQILRGRPAGDRGAYATEVINRQVHQMARLVDDLLDLSRVTTGRLDLRRAPVDVRDVLRAALEASRPAIEGGGHELVVTLPPDAILVDGDQMRLAQVVGNLLNNAARYTDRGGRIALSAEVQGAEAVIAVRDSGIGIPPEMLQRVFEMFAQLESARGGLGVGLTLARRLVALHGGSITAWSEGRGRGSLFTVRLPTLPSGAREAKAPEGERANPAAAGLLVLVVDDNVDSAETMGMFLEMYGNRVHVAHDGPDALRLGAELRPDVLLLDIGLPTMSGLEVARRARAEEWGRGLTLIAVSGWGQEADKKRSREAGFDHHLTKPVDHDALQRWLAAVRPRPAC